MLIDEGAPALRATTTADDAAAASFRLADLDEGLAPRVGELFYRVFGYTYSDPAVYDGRELWRRACGGDLGCILVVDRDGRVIGYFDHRFSFGDGAVAELGPLLTDPELPEVYRAQIVNVTVRACVDRIRRCVVDHGTRLVVTTDSTDHTLTQRLSSRVGMRTVGILFGTIPAFGHRLRPVHYATAAPGRPPIRPERAVWRRAETLSVYPVRSRMVPYDVSLPERFAAILGRIYERLAVPVTFRAPAPPDPETRLATYHGVGRGIARVVAGSLGADAPDRLLARVRHFVGGHVPAVHLLVPLDAGDPRPVVDALCDGAGALFGGLMPRFQGRDMLVLQVVSGGIDPTLTEAHIDDEIAREVFRMARAAPSGPRGGP